jgi:hypothetical protein
MARTFYVLNNGMVYKFGKRAVLELLRAVSCGGPPDKIQGIYEPHKIDFDLAALTKESAKQKYLDIVKELELGG